jgi:hypothetical protein
MNIDALDLARDDEAAVEAASGRRFRINSAVAVTVAVLATFTGLCKVKDDNIVQAMQQAQADKLDHWNFYQARNLREELAKATALQLRLQSQAQAAAPSRVQWDAAADRYEALAREQAQKKEDLRQQALADQKTYDSLNFRDDQFDLSDAAVAIAISMLAIASLTQFWWLYGLSLVPAAFGIVMGTAGLAGLQLHPDVLARLLS